MSYVFSKYLFIMPNIHSHRASIASSLSSLLGYIRGLGEGGHAGCELLGAILDFLVAAKDRQLLALEAGATSLRCCFEQLERPAGALYRYYDGMILLE